MADISTDFSLFCIFSLSEKQNTFPVALPSASNCISSHMATDVFSKFSGPGGSALPFRGGKSLQDSLGNAGFVC